jgi:predicted  nucleic acid-binding Zn-ribbon protein
MSTQNHFLGALSHVDQRLDELNEEFGDLPELEKDKQRELINAKSMVEETEGIIKELVHFVSVAKVTLVELKDKEEKLSKQQFLVRNNKEFDALSKEIESLKQEHATLSNKLRSEGIKEENLARILEEQKQKATDLDIELNKIKEEIEELAGEQKQIVRDLRKTKEKIEAKVLIANLKEYNRIRVNHNDTAVQIKRNCCSGCFNAVPPQRIVEIRNNKDKIFLCEHCGRILLSDDLEINDSLVDEVIA